MSIPIAQIDAFTSVAFGGNPAAVCILPAARSAEWMQDVAAEMNLAETAFLLRQDDGFSLRWFTPMAEVDLCGHATLASAHMLWESGLLAASETARFHTRSGLLTAVRRDAWIELDFPATPAETTTAPPGMLRALGAKAIFVGKSRFDYLVEVASEAEVRALTPDFAALGSVDARGVIVTSRASVAACDFVSRFFAPGVGINEDPVTGSAHCCLMPYWSAKVGKTTLLAHQVSARGGVLQLRLEGDRVRLAGQAVTALRGELLV